MMKRIISMACLLLVAAVGTLAQHWTVNARAWQYDMTAYAQLKVDGSVVSDYADYEVAAFCGDECRGVAKVLTVEGDSPVLYMRIRSNVTDGETITFRVYQASTQEEIRLEETVEFETQTMAGTPGEPLLLTLSDVLKGDVNGDGEINTVDASYILMHLVGRTPDDFVEAAADVDDSGEIDTLDATAILKKLVE